MSIVLYVVVYTERKGKESGICVIYEDYTEAYTDCETSNLEDDIYFHTVENHILIATNTKVAHA